MIGHGQFSGGLRTKTTLNRSWRIWQGIYVSNEEIGHCAWPLTKCPVGYGVIREDVGTDSMIGVTNFISTPGISTRNPSRISCA